jgi:malate dehydrogenase (oxaloacetate-decarboxylating)(NADP+)
MIIKKESALNYHSEGRPGKIAVVPTKPYSSQYDLSLAYSPGVAEPCKEIAANPHDVYKYTAKGNLVAVISNGTAVLGLGDIGPLASKPVMEGKGLLFKIFADIDVFDIEVDASDVDEFVRTVKNIAPTFGGINLEDIKAPEAFEIERRLKEELDIPVMHDDQHGTAIISSAALLNALELTNKKIEDVKIVVNGAGAAAIMCAHLYVKLGANLENILMLDSQGVLNTKRGQLSEMKDYFQRETDISTLEEAIKGADVFLGLSKGNVLSKEMVQSMANRPIVFALANPVAEISYEDGIASREDIIMATGRSDAPNQVNNVLGFPYIFRGALDVKATTINEEMKLAAVKALAELTKEPVPEEVTEAYNEVNLIFSKDYIIPKPLDPRLLTTVAPAVAKAAMESGVAREPIEDWDEYNRQLSKRLGSENALMKGLERRAKRDPQRIVFAEAHDVKILKAASTVAEQKIAHPILLGSEEIIRSSAAEFSLDLTGCKIIDARAPENQDLRDQLGHLFFEKRKRKGLTLSEAKKLMRERNYFAAGMLEAGMADAAISGLTRNYPDTIRPALQVLGKEKEALKIVGMYVVITQRGPLFFADTTINYEPTTEELVDITLQVNDAVKRMKIKPVIAMLSYSNFGSSQSPCAQKVSKAVEILHRSHPDVLVDGEMQANFAMDTELLEEIFPFSQLANEKVNTLIFPNLGAGNIAYKLTQNLASTDAIGPILLGISKPFHVLQLGSTVREIINMVKVASMDAQAKKTE